MKRSIDYLTPEYVSNLAHIDITAFNQVISNIIASKKICRASRHGLTQHANGTQNVTALLNLCTLKGGKRFQCAGNAMCRRRRYGLLPGLEAIWRKLKHRKRGLGININMKEGKKITKALKTSCASGIYYGYESCAVASNLNEVHTQLRSMFVIYQTTTL